MLQTCYSIYILPGAHMEVVRVKMVVYPTGGQSSFKTACYIECNLQQHCLSVKESSCTMLILEVIYDFLIWFIIMSFLQALLYRAIMTLWLCSGMLNSFHHNTSIFYNSSSCSASNFTDFYMTVIMDYGKLHQKYEMCMCSD